MAAGRPLLLVGKVDPKCKKLQVPITQTQFDKLKGFAGLTDSSISAVLRNLIDEWIEEMSAPPYQGLG
jgi:hypothetical protein